MTGWYHTIDLPDGTSTAGVFDTRGTARLLRWPAGLEGGRCLDVGTCDGFWAFEMERRGAAEVVAIDVEAPDRRDAWLPDGEPGRSGGVSGASRAGRRFEAARRILKSRVHRVTCSVYDLDPEVLGRFDVVFWGTLLVHLRDPLAALQRVRDVCAGELLLIEGLDARLDVVARGVPSARLTAAHGQWWRVNTAALLHLLDAAGFDVLWTSRRFLTPFGVGALGRRQSAIRRSQAALLRGVATVPGVAPVAGLALGTYDVAVRARPRGPAVPSAPVHAEVP